MADGFSPSSVYFTKTYTRKSKVFIFFYSDTGAVSIRDAVHLDGPIFSKGEDEILYLLILMVQFLLYIGE